MSNRLVPTSATQDRAVYILGAFIIAILITVAAIEVGSIKHWAKLYKWLEHTATVTSLCLWVGYVAFNTFMFFSEYESGDSQDSHPGRRMLIGIGILAIFITGCFFAPVFIAYQVATIVGAVCAVGYTFWWASPIRPKSK